MGLLERTPAGDATSYDVAVIGGGINGTAVAALLTRRGYKVLLAERDDFGSGSSSRSSRIMHCGLNYLASAVRARNPLQIAKFVGLARKMMRDRSKLSRALGERILPHPFLVPIRHKDKIKPWHFDIGLRVLRSLGGYDTPLNYRRYAGHAFFRHPLASYFDGQVVGFAQFTEFIFDWPERLCVDYALEAASNGATVLNYTELVEAQNLDDHWVLRLADRQESGAVTTVETCAVVNMAGIWSDDVNELAQFEHNKTVTPNKGCHIAVRLPEAFQGTGIINRNELGHLFLCVPWRDFHILGPTETSLGESVRAVTAGQDDVASILADANMVIPRAHLTQADVMFRWAGMRPATFEVGNPLGQWQRKFYRSSNRGTSRWLSMSWGRLADHHDTAREALNYVSSVMGTPGHAPVIPQDAALAGNLAEILRTEAPKTVADVMFRRTGWGWDSDLGLSHLSEVSQALAASGQATDTAKLEEVYIDMLCRDFCYEPD